MARKAIKLIKPHLAYQTSFTRTGQRDLTNRKPYRNADMKRAAHEHVFIPREGRYKGTYRSYVDVLYHREYTEKDRAAS